MNGHVEILRDRAGVAHIFADATGSAYCGLGYAMAEDRLWQMDRLRRRALGRQAEILGPEYVQADLMHRAVGIPAIADRELEQTDERTRALLESFVDGVNRYVDSHQRELPPEFAQLGYEPEPFSASDVIAILRGLWWSLNGRLYSLSSAEAANVLPEHLRAAYLEPEAPENRILPPGSPYPPGPTHQVSGMGMSDNTGSNNWAIAATHTSAGKALLCGDPHQPFWIPSSWYEYAIHGPDDDAAGAGPAGVPGLWWGSNGTIAWAITNNAASTRDLYREQVHPTDPNQYRDGTTWRRFEASVVEIAVRGQPAVRHTQRATVRGPIVNHVLTQVDEAPEPPISLRWVGQEHLDDVRAGIEIGRARDWSGFRDALRDWSVAVFNFVYADAAGRVGYQCAGRVPIRGRLTRGYREANEPADAWHGYVPFEALPSAVDPSRGYVASANERVAPDDYPFPLHGSWGGGYRAERIRQAIEGQPRFDRAAAIALQNDVKSCRAERLCPALLDRLGSNAPELRTALEGWDFRYTLDSSAPTVFDTFMDVWQARVVRARFPERLHALVQSQPSVAARLIERADLLDWFAGDLQSEIAAAAQDTLAQLRKRYGDDPSGWQWRNLHHAHWKHPASNPAFDIGPADVDGGSDTVRNTGMVGALGGSEYRIVVDFAEPERFWAVQNIGNSGVPGNPHYQDQFEDWRAGRYHVVSLRRAEVERDLESQTVLEVAPAVVQ